MNFKSATISRRDFFRYSGGGLGGIAFSALQAADPLVKREPHFAPKAKSVLFLFMVGGSSGMDLFDPKPALQKYAGKPLPESVGRPGSQFTKGDAPLLASTRVFQQHGQSGQWMSDLMPHLAKRVDDICFLKSCWCNSTVHAPAMYELHTGRILMGYPSLGSWVTYGLGNLSANLPAYCVLPQPEGVPEGGAPCWGAAYLPTAFQGTMLRPSGNPILNLRPDRPITAEQNKRVFDLVRDLNEASPSAAEAEFQSRLATYELAFRMQQHAPQAVDLSQETVETKRAYGLEQKITADFGTRLLLARRLIERGVRFISVYSGGGPLITQWDAHDDVNQNHEIMCQRVDQPISALLQDLKQRGLLQDTLVVWCSEFGRTPYSQGSKGRDHNPYGYTMWMAGGGIKGGQSIGETDEFGLYATGERKISVHDFHATILHALGLDHELLTYRHNGRDERLTDIAGEVVEEAFA